MNTLEVDGYAALQLQNGNGLLAEILVGAATRVARRLVLPFRKTSVRSPELAAKG